MGNLTELEIQLIHDGLQCLKTLTPYKLQTDAINSVLNKLANRFNTDNIVQYYFYSAFGKSKIDDSEIYKTNIFSFSNSINPMQLYKDLYDDLTEKDPYHSWTILSLSKL